MSTQSIKFTLTFGVSQKALYDALTDQMKLSAITRCPAQFVAEEGKEFVLYQGRIQGKNLELKEDLIRQEWKISDWSSFSEVRIEFDEVDDDEVEVTVKQTGIPAGTNLGSVTGGWMGMIFEPLSGILGYPITDRQMN
jgi:activator of HSP90 ATPase